MLSEFYRFIANNTIDFFQQNHDSIRPGERYCLKLDNDEVVAGVDHSLRERCKQLSIYGTYNYNDVYSTFTIRLNPTLEVVVASKINGMTDDFLATLRNADLTDNHFPILMITQTTTIDTITSGTADLSSNGKPFHFSAIEEKIAEDIKKLQVTTAEKTLLTLELERKKKDRYSDKSSLFEYKDLLTVLERGSIVKTDYPNFGLLPDDDISFWTEENKIRERLEDNHSLFATIDKAYRFGNIQEDLESEFGKQLVNQLKERKKNNQNWFDNQTYKSITALKAKKQRTYQNPLSIDENSFSFFATFHFDNAFVIDENVFIRADGVNKAKSRKKNILIYNPERHESATVQIRLNKNISKDSIGILGFDKSKIESHLITLELKSNGCSFGRADIEDKDNNIKYQIKVCLIDVFPSYLENIHTAFSLNIPKKVDKSEIRVYGISDELLLNPNDKYSLTEELLIKDKEYSCSYNQTLKLVLGEESINSDDGYVRCKIHFGNVCIPLQIYDDPSRSTELTGISALKTKYELGRSIEYRGNKLVAGTNEYFVKNGDFKNNLVVEKFIIDNKFLAVQKDELGNYIEYPLNIPESIAAAYLDLVSAIKEKKSVPSLVFYKKDLKEYAEKYITVIFREFESIPSGSTLSELQNKVLLLGCVINNIDSTISMTPLHPINVMYQLELMKEKGISEVRNDLAKKLSPLYLLPYIRDTSKNLYHAFEQTHSPEWRYYAQISNKRYQGARKFVEKLVCEKVKEYKEHFTFLFNDIGNNTLFINLINMGDCQEVFRGLLSYYSQNINEHTELNELLSFTINIYTEPNSYNEFLLLSDQKKLKTYVNDLYRNNDYVSDLILAMTSKIKCFYRNPEETEYQYAHLTFYEMPSKQEAGSGRMDLITTGIALNGLTSGVPSVLNKEWYKTGFGTKYAPTNQIVRLATYYNALYNSAFSGSSYEPDSGLFTEVEKDQKNRLNKIYKSSNWVVFVDPKVDLSFFQKANSTDSELMIIHYSDQYTTASGYDDITVTQKSKQYNLIIQEQLSKKGVSTDSNSINSIISLFNAINGSWMLRLITAKKLSGAADSYFSREKMSILSAIKLCMAFYSHKDIVWVPISLEEMLRVSGGAGLSQNDGLLSAKNLGFEQRATSDDILLVGIEGPKDDIKVYLHPVEVKIGQNPSGVIAKAKSQVINTYHGLWNALWPESEKRNLLETKMTRNFFMQLVIVCCEKLKLYGVYSDESWDDVLDTYRYNLLNEEYEFSKALDAYIGKGTVISFSTGAQFKSYDIDGDVCVLSFPEKLGSEYMVWNPAKIESDLIADKKDLPARLCNTYIKSETVETYTEPIPNQIPLVQEKQIYVAESEGNNNSSQTVIAVDNTLVESSKEAGSQDENTGINVVFGTDISNGSVLLWNPNDSDQVFHTNTGIIGTMGTGKTQFTKSVITQLYREQNNNVDGMPVGILIFDYKGDYNESKVDFVNATSANVLKPYHLPFNPLALTKSPTFRPLLPIHTANAFKDTLSKVYGLGPKQQDTLFQCILNAYHQKGIQEGNYMTWDKEPPTFEDVYEVYNNDDDIKKNDSLAAAMNKLHQFQVFEGKAGDTKSLFDLLTGVVVIDLSGYDQDIQSLVIAITLDLFYSQMQASGSSKLVGKYRQLTKMILVDEADNFMSQGFPALKKILKEGREFGVGTILSTQFLKHFGTSDDDYAKYILTWVVHNVADLKTSDVDFVFNTESKSMNEQKLFNDIKKLKKHNSIVKIGTGNPIYIEDLPFWKLPK